MVSEIASIELCRKLGWYTCTLTTAQVLARERAKERKAWSKYTGSSKKGSTVAKKSESTLDARREEAYQTLILQNLEEKFGTQGSAETIAYLKSLLKTLEGVEE